MNALPKSDETCAGIARLGRMELNDVHYRARDALDAVLVNPPPLHQGIADALRVAFVPAFQNLPDELAELLVKLK